MPQEEQTAMVKYLTGCIMRKIGSIRLKAIAEIIN